MVCSLDGFVVKNDGDVSWLKSTDRYEEGVSLTQEDIDAYLSAIDCYVMGSKTYEHALELGWPYGETPVIVMTKRNLKSEKKNVEFYTGGIKELMDTVLKSTYPRIWVVGGPALVKDFLQKRMVDELIVSFLPVIVGEGKLFFDYVGIEERLHLKDCKAYTDGMVEMVYEVMKG